MRFSRMNMKLAFQRFAKNQRLNRLHAHNLALHNLATGIPKNKVAPDQRLVCASPLQLTAKLLKLGLTKGAGELTLSLDVRPYSTAHLVELEAQLFELARGIGKKRGVCFEFGARTSAEVAPSHPELIGK